MFFTKNEKVLNKAKPLTEKITHRLKAYWIGHATFLIRMDDRWILTDPIWNPRILNLLGRHVEPGMELKELPEIDFILVSHAHLDHLDTYTLEKISRKTHLVLPQGAPDFGDYNFNKLSYISNYDTIYQDDIKITVVPARHFGGRWLIDNLWDGDPYVSYVIEYHGMTVYFAGDTGYSAKYFRTIGAMFQIDLALIPFGPVGSFFQDEYGNAVHVNPIGAIQMFQDVNAKFMIPMHHTTFYSNPSNELPKIRQAINESGLSQKIFLLKQGGYKEFFPIEGQK
ncbi:MAG: MBL fold metallo-hydrolase [Leptospiraceae bacterium]|nr:MBL fold metallo-hydrolase [Leptospiraceae bacterium]